MMEASHIFWEQGRPFRVVLNKSLMAEGLNKLVARSYSGFQSFSSMSVKEIWT